MPDYRCALQRSPRWQLQDPRSGYTCTPCMVTVGTTGYSWLQFQRSRDPTAILKFGRVQWLLGLLWEIVECFDSDLSWADCNLRPVRHPAEDLWERTNRLMTQSRQAKEYRGLLVQQFEGFLVKTFCGLRRRLWSRLALLRGYNEEDEDEASSPTVFTLAFVGERDVELNLTGLGQATESKLRVTLSSWIDILLHGSAELRSTGAA